MHAQDDLNLHFFLMVEGTFSLDATHMFVELNGCLIGKCTERGVWLGIGKAFVCKIH